MPQSSTKGSIPAKKTGCHQKLVAAKLVAANKPEWKGPYHPKVPVFPYYVPKGTRFYTPLLSPVYFSYSNILLW